MGERALSFCPRLPWQSIMASSPRPPPALATLTLASAPAMNLSLFSSAYTLSCITGSLAQRKHDK